MVSVGALPETSLGHWPEAGLTVHHMVGRHANMFGMNLSRVPDSTSARRLAPVVPACWQIENFAGTDLAADG